MYIDISYSQKMHHYVQSFNFADSSENPTHKKACNSQNKQRQTSILFSTLQWPYISIRTSHIIGNSLESLQNNFFRQVNNTQNLQAPHYLPLYQWATSGVASNRVSNARNIPCRDVFMALMQQGWISLLQLVGTRNHLRFQQCHSPRKNLCTYTVGKRYGMFGNHNGNTRMWPVIN